VNPKQNELVNWDWLVGVSPRFAVLALLVAGVAEVDVINLTDSIAPDETTHQQWLGALVWGWCSGVGEA
jgi:hypothetical protein